MARVCPRTVRLLGNHVSSPPNGRARCTARCAAGAGRQADRPRGAAPPEALQRPRVRRAARRPTRRADCDQSPFQARSAPSRAQACEGERVRSAWRRVVYGHVRAAVGRARGLWHVSLAQEAGGQEARRGHRVEKSHGCQGGARIDVSDAAAGRGCGRGRSQAQAPKAAAAGGGAPGWRRSERGGRPGEASPAVQGAIWRDACGEAVGFPVIPMARKPVASARPLLDALGCPV
eukprot:5596317-Prymnesium_polylepis.2